MIGFLTEWAGLLVRWFHLTMGIAWIGASFYFVWLNNAVRPPAEGEAPEGVAGDLWAVHGGAFYRVQKYGGAPPKLPSVLHWFQWEAYLTWLSGFTLLILHFWLSAGTTMVDTSVMALTSWQAVGIGAGTLVGGWLVYDGLCKSPVAKQPALLGGLLAAFVVGVDVALFHLLSARAAYLHVGAMLGTWMAANVWFVIIPGQRAMVDAMVAGREPPVERGKAGSLRSLHNNYITLPVLFVMVSGHFPSTYGSAYGWLILLGIAAAGVAVRHALNVAEQERPMPWLWPVAAVIFVATALLARPRSAPAVEGEVAPSFTEVQLIISQRCLGCHSEQPILAGLASPPKGLLLDSPEHIRAASDKIRANVVDSKIMPLGNLTAMTDEEREVIRRWLDAGG
ncbi:MAG: urate hydroxylase PuuD [Alphaproteobacteria bacterium]|nr:urate hydroxylase PuuD [Alphaproteobacteria bacterium]MCB9698057.1 urate hydroxylase PuuD [Alphaproteobacteria bacterium]